MALRFTPLMGWFIGARRLKRASQRRRPSPSGIGERGAAWDRRRDLLIGSGFKGPLDFKNLQAASAAAIVGLDGQLQGPSLYGHNAELGAKPLEILGEALLPDHREERSGAEPHLQALAEASKGVGRGSHLLRRRLQRIDREVIAEPIEQKRHQIREGQPGMGELGNADADHTEFAKVVEAEAADDVVDVVGGLDTVVDIISIALQIGITIRLGEEINGVTQGCQHLGIGVSEAAFRQSLESGQVIGTAEPSRFDQVAPCRIPIQQGSADLHRVRFAQSMGRQEHIAGKRCRHRQPDRQAPGRSGCSPQ